MKRPSSQFIQSERGSALVEFAMFMPILVFLLLGMVDYSIYIQKSMELQAAASGAAAWGAVPGNESNLTGIQNTAVSLAPSISGATTTASNLWTCTPGGTSVTSATMCTGSITPYKYVVVTVTGTVPRALSYPGIPNGLTMIGKATFRVPWSP
jgi:Flp pilus assembly protein TadG